MKSWREFSEEFSNRELISIFTLVVLVIAGVIYY